MHRTVWEPKSLMKVGIGENIGDHRGSFPAVSAMNTPSKSTVGRKLADFSSGESYRRRYLDRFGQFLGQFFKLFCAALRSQLRESMYRLAFRSLLQRASEPGSRRGVWDVPTPVLSFPAVEQHGEPGLPALFVIR